MEARCHNVKRGFERTIETLGKSAGFVAVIGHWLFVIYCILPAVVLSLPVYQIAKTSVVSIVLGVPFFLAVLSVRQAFIVGSERGRKILLFGLMVVWVPLIGVGLYLVTIEFYFALWFGSQLPPLLLMTPFESSLSEGFEFLYSYADTRIFMIILLVVSPVVGAVICVIGVMNFRRLGIYVVGLHLVGVLLAVIAVAVRPTPFFEVNHNKVRLLWRGVSQFIERERDRRTFDLNGAGLVDGKVRWEGNSKRSLFVLVIGESCNRSHLQLYGYQRATTPLLAGLGERLNVFTDVVSPHSHTELCLKEMLTFKNQDNGGVWSDYPSLINCFNEAGFKTYWISNQEIYGVYGNAVSTIAGHSNVVLYNEIRTGDQKASKHDGDLVVHLRKILRSDADVPHKFIVLHLMGSHALYRNRYPSEFEKLDASDIDAGNRLFLNRDKRQVINEYDNSILYNDYVIDSLIKVIDEEGLSSYVLYLSDHGEEVYDERDFMGHTESVGNRFMLEIPFTLWMSGQFMKDYPDVGLAVTRRLDAPFMTDDLIHAVLDISSIGTDFLDLSRSIISKNFDSHRKRIYSGKDYDRELRKQKGGFVFQNVWAHRVNDILSLKSAVHRFPGIELDLVYEEGETGFFDVRHPPAVSRGLTLDDYFDQASDYPDLNFWLDLKNLTHKNAPAAVIRLEALMKKYSLHGRLLLESPEANLLPQFRSVGIEVSYYLPVFDLAGTNEREKMRIQAEIRSCIASNSLGRISFPGSMRRFVSDSIVPIFPSIRICTWFTDKSMDVPSDVVFIGEIVKSSRFEVILVQHQM